MNWRLEIRPAARQEFLEASDWYLGSGLDVKENFVTAVRNTIASVQARPLAFPVVFGSAVRRAVVRKFPYSVFFVAEDDRIIVLSIFHDSRNPIIWRGRID